MVMLYGLAIKNPPAMWETQGDPCSIPGSGRSPGGGQGNPVQYSCLENPMDGGAWQATYSPWGCEESDTTEHTAHPTEAVISLWCDEVSILPQQSVCKSERRVERGCGNREGSTRRKSSTQEKCWLYSLPLRNKGHYKWQITKIT